MKKFIDLCLILLLLFFTQCLVAQDNCEQLFTKTMEDLQKQVETQKLSDEQANALFMKTNEELSLSHPDCFPPVVEEVPMKSQGAHMKVDSKDLSLEEIRVLEAKYIEFQAQCNKEHAAQLARLNTEEAAQVIHDCTLEKLSNTASN